MIRLILELHLSKPQAQEDTSGGKNSVNIQINNLTDKKKPPIEIIEVTQDAETATTGSDGHSEEHAEVNPDGPKAGSDDGLQ